MTERDDGAASPRRWEMDRRTFVGSTIVVGEHEPADNWRVRQDMARLWVDMINRHGGDATFVSLPERGIRGNTHFALSDLNNHEIADQITAFLAEKNLA